MARYFFDIHDSETSLDDTGVELATYEAARHQAIKLLPDLARDCLPSGDQNVLEVVLRTEGGDRLFKATLSFKCEKLA